MKMQQQQEYRGIGKRLYPGLFHPAGFLVKFHWNHSFRGNSLPHHYPVCFIRVKNRTTFIAPPVEPPQAPMNIKARITILAPACQEPKSAVTKPVVVMIEIA